MRERSQVPGFGAWQHCGQGGQVKGHVLRDQDAWIVDLDAQGGLAIHQAIEIPFGVQTDQL